MDTNEDADYGSRMLQVIQAVAISPKDAKALVRKYTSASEESHPGATAAERRKIVGDKIIDHYAWLAAASGGATALAGVVPGIGTLAAMLGGGLADVTMSMKFQVDMTMCLAEVYGWDLDGEEANHLSLLIAASGAIEKFGGDAVTRVASKAGVSMLRQYLAGSALVVARELFKRIGITFTRAALQKAIPFGVGVAVSSAVNYGLTQFVGATAQSWFVIDQESTHDTVTSGEAGDDGIIEGQIVG